MSITIFYLILLIVQIVMLVKATKNMDEKNWSLLSSTIVISIVLVLVFFAYTRINMEKIGWAFILYYVINIIAGVLYILMLIISMVVKSIKNRKNEIQKVEEDECEKKKNQKSLNRNLAIIVVTFLVAVFLEDLPYRIQQRNERILENNAKEHIINLLNQRYGDGDFEIVEVDEECINCAWFSSDFDGLNFTISTSYLDEHFTVGLVKKDFEIYKNDFLNKYYKEKYEITNIESYLKESKTKKLNEMLSHNFNAKIDFDGITWEKDINGDYGHVLSLDELSDLIKLKDPKIEIKDDLTTEEELLNYLLKLLKYYIEDFDTSSITYTENRKYFRYKYDYTKLGVYNYTDNYYGYGGYVLAGEYRYSEEQGRNILEDEDKIVRINVMGKVTTFNLDDILNSN